MGCLPFKPSSGKAAGSELVLILTTCVLLRRCGVYSCGRSVCAASATGCICGQALSLAQPTPVSTAHPHSLLQALHALNGGSVLGRHGRSGSDCSSSSGGDSGGSQAESPRQTSAPPYKRQCNGWTPNQSAVGRERSGALQSRGASYSRGPGREWRGRGHHWSVTANTFDAGSLTRLAGVGTAYHVRGQIETGDQTKRPHLQVCLQPRFVSGCRCQARF